MSETQSMDETQGMKESFDKMTVRGVIQAGANWGQEIGFFRNYTKNIILCEPIPECAAALSAGNSDLMVFDFALGNEDRDDGVLHVSTNSGVSSSLLMPVDHITHYKEILFPYDVTVRIRKFSTIIRDNSINMAKYNVLVTDCQGYDLEAIKGFEHHIDNIDLVVSEFINTNLYEGNAGLQDMVEHLGASGFVFAGQTPEYLGAGNAFFTRKPKA